MADALEAGPEVGDEDLGALVEVYGLAFEGGGIAEAGKVGDDEVDEGGGGVGGFVDAGREGACEALGAWGDQPVVSVRERQYGGTDGVEDFAGFADTGYSFLEEGDWG